MTTSIHNDIETDPIGAEFERRIDYATALRIAEKEGKSVSEVQRAWNLEQERPKVLAYDASTLAEKERKLEQAKARLEAEKAEQREQVSSWQSMLKQRDTLQSRIAELTATLPTPEAISDRRRLCKLELRAPYDPLRDYIFDGHLAWLTQAETYAGLVKELLRELSGELDDLEEQIQEFAKQHHIEISAPVSAKSGEQKIE